MRCRWNYFARINTLSLVISVVTVAISLIWMILILDDITRYWQNCKSFELLCVNLSLGLAHFHIIIIIITDQVVISQDVTTVYDGLLPVVRDLNDLVLLVRRNHHDLTRGDVGPVDPIGLHYGCSVIIHYRDFQSEMWTSIKYPICCINNLQQFVV